MGAIFNSVVHPHWVLSDQTQRDITELHEGVSQPQVDVHVTVTDADGHPITVLPVSVIQWLDTIPKSTALLIVENYYAGNE